MKFQAKKLAFAAVLSMSVCGLAESAYAKSTFMKTGGRTTQPIGHYELCQRDPNECRQRTQSKRPMKLTRKIWSAMVNINNTVNVMVAPKTDLEMWGREEIWSYPKRQGDCEDYVLEKRLRLMKAGAPAGSLLITVVRQPNGDGHAVLTVRTDRGDFILDNMQQKIRHWTETEYRYLKRQSSRNSGRWVSINDGRANTVGSID